MTDDKNFYLTDIREQPLGFEFSTALAAKRAAMKLVRERKHPHVEVWHRWEWGIALVGLVNEEGWSDV